MAEKFEIKLTPDDILKHQFKNVRKGYDSTEVDNYLDEVITDYETFMDAISELRQQNLQLRQQLTERSATKPATASTDRRIETESDHASTNFDIIQRLSKLERKVFNLEQELHPND